MPPTISRSQGYTYVGISSAYAVSYNNTTPLVIGMIVWSNRAQYRPMQSATYNGVPMEVAVRYSSSRGQFEMWYLKNAPIGTYNMQWNCYSGDSGAGYTIHCISMAAVDPADPFRSFKWANCSGCTSINSTILDLQVGDFVLGLPLHYRGNYDTTPNPGQTIIHQLRTGTSADYAAISSVSTYTIATADTENEGGYWSLGSYAGIIIASLKRREVGNQVIWMMSKIRDFFKDLHAGLIPPEELQLRYRGLKEQGLLTI